MDETGALRLVGEAEDKVTDFSLCGRRVEVEVEDCAFVRGSYGGQGAGFVRSLRLLGADGDEQGRRDAARGQLATGEHGVGGALSGFLEQRPGPGAW